ncbi:MAG: DUF362 domain-containing protein, partial [Smithellaceae bacterium]
MHLTRRELIKQGSLMCLTTMLGCSRHKMPSSGDVREKEFEIVHSAYTPYPLYFSDQKPLVSIVKVNEKWSDAKSIDYAVTRAIDLIGGINQVAAGKENILLKPNLLNLSPADTTKPQVVEALAGLMKKAGKNVCIGEASVASWRNVKAFVSGNVCSAKGYQDLQAIQDDVFGALGYRDLSGRIDVPLVNLHVGKMMKLDIPDNYVFKEIHIHEALYNADMICSMPMMKTHTLAGVTLAMKNVGIGAYPGLVYGSVRSAVHSRASELEPTGTSTAIIDMVKANKIGLNVVDATMAMEGNGPSTAQGGKPVKMNLIIAGTNALATDMVAARVMGYMPDEIDTFQWAWKAGMKPSRLDDITVVGESMSGVARPFARPRIVPYQVLKD